MITRLKQCWKPDDNAEQIHAVPAQPDFSNPKFDDRKLTEYALNPNRPVGADKARVIKSATGLGREDAAEVKRQILDQVGDGDPCRVGPTTWLPVDS